MASPAADAPPDPHVDIMNDPAYHPNPPPATRHEPAEPDHCRICRSEGSESEPLYHPCKCSGSIKFVHQDCLMEWLQHSQKKYCELCKTPFAFTKVYDPSMPSQIPTPLFLRRLARHLVQNVILWARAVLVALVWLGWLPWMVRWMWRAWFWFSDGGWFSMDTEGGAAGGRGDRRSPVSEGASATATSPAHGSSVLSYLSSSSLSPAMSPVNGGGSASNISLSSSVANATSHYPDGIFFDNNPFANLTRSPIFNRLIVDILEGQLLTALIVISFIGIFLIREWVVQQQPALGGGADDAALLDFERPRAEPAQDVEEPQEDVPDEVPEAEPVDEELLNRAFGPIRTGEDLEERAARPIAQPRRRRVFPANAQPAVAVNEDVEVIGRVESTDEPVIGTLTPNELSEDDGHIENADVDGAGAGLITSGEARVQRPQPTRENTSTVTDFRRNIEEGGSASGSQSGSHDFNFGSPSTADFRFGDPVSQSSFAWDANAEDFHSGVGNGWTVVERTPQASRPTEGETLPEGTSMPTPVSLADDTPDTDTRDASEATPKASNVSWTPTEKYDKIFGATEKGKEPEKTEEEDEEVRPTEMQHLQTYDGAGLGKGKKVEDFSPPAAGTQHEDQDSDNQSDSTVFSQLSRDVGPSEWSSSAQAGDPATSGRTPGREDSPTVETAQTVAGPATPSQILDPLPEPHVEEIPVRQHIPQFNNQGLHDRMRRLAEERGIPEERIQEILDRFAQPPHPPVAAAPARRGGLFGFFAGDQDRPNANDEHVDAPDDNALPAEFQPLGAMAERQRFEQELAEREEDVARLENAIIEEDGADDFEGVMELVGMRGPLVGLVQNAAISSVLITATVAIGVVLPYVTGKTVMLIIAHPILFFFQVPVLVTSFFAEFFVDSATFLGFSFLLLLDQTVKFLINKLGYIVPGLSRLAGGARVTHFLQNWASDGQNRVVAKFVGLEHMYLGMRRRGPVHPPFSVIARESLANVCSTVAGLVGIVQAQYTKYLASGIAAVAQYIPSSFNFPSPVAFVRTALERTFGSNTTVYLSSLTANATTPATVGSYHQIASTPELYQWSTGDKLAVVLLGYLTFTVAGAVYLRTRRASTSSVEKFAVDFLEQCGGVMKVVLIIGIEMFVFPLYCGAMLDLAMLPLFEDATIASRVRFALEFPWTSIFVHWFVGTCYMFHFALFVSMCRKIMRAGVLYFIRDPDDPTFHPVRDVLDRPVMKQLQKIGFSGLIYGILVLVCLGGVVWTLAAVTKNVLPIHWSSNEPVLEFPVDLLFYNFLMPVAVKFFKPSDGLQNMYDWWFRGCARMLRLSSFLFDEREPDEEGYHYRRTWKAWLLARKGDVENPVVEGRMPPEEAEKQGDVYFKRTGRFVRAPASDSVRRPKDSSVFIPVDENNKRLDGLDDPVDSPYGPESQDYRLVYLPPMFATRIALVVLAIWGFAAATGVGVTIGPLLLGRAVLKSLVPPHIRLNDIYALSVGLYIVGGIAILASKYSVARDAVRDAFFRANPASAPRPSTWKSVREGIVRAAKISYVFTSFAIVLPTLVALMIEFYVIIPIHTYLLGDEQHVIHFIQDWTLGVLYVKMMGRMLLLDADSRWARSLRGVVARGYLDPDVKLATKEFIAPAGGFMLAALVLPLGLGFFAVKIFLRNAEEMVRSRIYRYAYPAVCLVAVLCAAIYGTWMLIERWRRSVRDEVYLIGERLHNHGEDRPPDEIVPSLTSSPAGEVNA